MATLEGLRDQLAAFAEILDAAFTKKKIPERTQIWIQVRSQSGLRSGFRLPCFSRSQVPLSPPSDPYYLSLLNAFIQVAMFELYELLFTCLEALGQVDKSLLELLQVRQRGCEMASALALLLPDGACFPSLSYENPHSDFPPICWTHSRPSLLRQSQDQISIAIIPGYCWRRLRAQRPLPLPWTAEAR